MPVETAKNYYLGKEGYKRMNCAQAVASAFKEKFNLSTEIIELFRAYGAGRAPEGLCGALYAVKYILERNFEEEKSTQLERYFLNNAGGITCKDIIACKKMSCLQCVEKSSKYLNELEI